VPTLNITKVVVSKKEFIKLAPSQREEEAKNISK
jgi:hypothetical protein